MKKLLVFFFSVVLLAGLAGASSYWPIIFGTANKGLDLTNQPMNADPDSMIVLDNFYVESDRSPSRRLGVITKTLSRTAYLGTMESSLRSRGLIYYYDLLAGDTVLNMVASSELISTGKLYLNYNNSWHTATNTSTTDAYLFNYSYPTNYVVVNDNFRGVSTVYFIQSADNSFKWFLCNNGGDTAVDNQIVTLKNAGSASSISGTLEFTVSSKQVKGTGTTFVSSAPKGSWIRASSTAPWYEVDYTTSETYLYLRSNFTETTTTVATAQKAGDISIAYCGDYLLYWKNRLWQYNISGYSNYSRLYCSAALSSATPAALETWTGSDTGFVDVPGNFVHGTGLIGVGDYLFCFKDFDYVVYQYNSSVVPPISIVKTWNYGCPSANTMAQVENGVIYWTGTELRYTTGFQDVSLSAPVANGLRYQYATGSKRYYYSLATTDFNNPTGIYDDVNKLYYLYFPNYTAGTTVGFVYDWDKKIWSGNDKFNNVDIVGKTYSPLTSILNKIVYHPVNNSNQLYEISATTETTVTGEIQSSDISFGDAKHQKKINWIEFWVHAPAPLVTSETCTLEASWYLDGTLQTTRNVSVTNSTARGYSVYSKVRLPVNQTCQFFRWRLRDINYGSDIDTTDSLSLIGGNICYDILNDN